MRCRIRLYSLSSTICLLGIFPTLLLAQTSMPHPITSFPKPPPSSTSSTASTPAMPDPVTSLDLGPPPLHASTNYAISLPVQSPHFHPFSAVAIQLKSGFGGIGIDLATPLAKDINIRGGGSFLAYDGGYYVDGMTLDGKINFRSVNVSMDWYPFHGGFRISPGITIYNGNSLSGTLSVPGGQNFSLGDGTYTSSPSDPVHGLGSMSFGKRTAPSFTLGWGNMIPHSGRRFSVPFEVGFQYIGAPKINFNLMGTSCNNTGCANIATDPTSQADLQQELTDINNEIAPLRFYPIISIGFAWAFGLRSTHTY